MLLEGGNLGGNAPLCSGPLGPRLRCGERGGTPAVGHPRWEKICGDIGGPEVGMSVEPGQALLVARPVLWGDRNPDPVERRDGGCF